MNEGKGFLSELSFITPGMTNFLHTKNFTNMFVYNIFAICYVRTFKISQWSWECHQISRRWLIITTPVKTCLNLALLDRDPLLAARLKFTMSTFTFTVYWINHAGSQEGPHQTPACWDRHRGLGYWAFHFIFPFHFIFLSVRCICTETELNLRGSVLVQVNYSL